MISIIVPFYNTEKYLEECLVSVKDQTFSDFECLMIDDGSTDNSRSIAQSFADADSRFKLLNKEHVGFSMAKNIGLDNAKGEYIAFLDSDDYLEPRYLELLYKCIANTNTDICCCRFNFFTNEKKDSRSLIKTECCAEIYDENRMDGIFTPKLSSFMWNKLYKRHIFDNKRFENVIALSDTLLCYQLFDKANKISAIPNFLINHRVHNENMTYRVRNFEPTYWEYRLNVYIKYCGFVCDHYPQSRKTASSRFFREFYRFIKPHLDEETFLKYDNDERVKYILNFNEENAYNRLRNRRQ